MPAEVARIVVEAEAASDNVMFPTPVLFAQREGVVLEDFRRPLPPIEVVGIDTQRDGSVDTLDFPPAQYTSAEVEVFTALLGAILLTAYLGGAVATHVRVGSPLFSHVLFGVYLGVLVWGGLALRDPRLRAMLSPRR